MDTVKQILSGYTGWAKEKLGISSPEEIQRAEERFKICITCPNFNKEEQKCNLCGCPKGSIKARIFNNYNACPDKPSRWKN